MVLTPLVTFYFFAPSAAKIEHKLCHRSNTTGNPRKVEKAVLTGENTWRTDTSSIAPRQTRHLCPVALLR